MRRLCLLLSLLIVFHARAQHPPGTLDSSFGINGIVIDSFTGGRMMTAYGIALQQDGKILTIGTSLNRYQASGRPDPSFGLDGHVDIHGGKVRVLSDGKIVTLSADNQGGSVTRLYPDGRIDSTYGANGIAVSASVRRSIFNFRQAVDY